MTSDATTETLLLRHLRGLVGQAVCLRRDEAAPVGRLLDVDAGHALIECGDGELLLVPLDILDRVESGASHDRALASKRWLHEQYGERMARSMQEREERLLLESLEMADGGSSPLEILVEAMQSRGKGKGR